MSLFWLYVAHSVTWFILIWWVKVFALLSGKELRKNSTALASMMLGCVTTLGHYAYIKVLVSGMVN